MTTIANFSRTDDGFQGEIRTLTLQAKATLLPTRNGSDKAPDYRVIAHDGIEIGGAWKRKSSGGNSYLSVRLDDPSFTAPVFANLVERNGQHLLIWNR